MYSVRQRNLLRRAFSLVELAIVLVIVGILFGAVVKSCVNGIETARIENTKDKLRGIAKKVTYYVCRFRKIIPFSTLVKLSASRDAWNTRIKIFEDLHLQNNYLCSLNSTYFRVVTPSENYTNVVFLFLSAGGNRVIDSLVSNGSVLIRNDDIYEIVTLGELKLSCCEYKKLKFDFNELSPIVEGEDYKETIVVSGGIPPYRCKFISGTDAVVKSYISILNGTSLKNPYCQLVSSHVSSRLLFDATNASTLNLNIEVCDNETDSPMCNSKEFVLTLIRRSL